MVRSRWTAIVMTLALVASVLHATMHLAMAGEGHFDRTTGALCPLSSVDAHAASVAGSVACDLPAVAEPPPATSQILHPTAVLPWRSRAPPSAA